MVSLKKNPYKSPKIHIFEKIHTKMDFFFKNPYLYGQIRTSGNTVSDVPRLGAVVEAAALISSIPPARIKSKVPKNKAQPDLNEARGGG